VRQENAHTASGDAVATARLLKAYLRTASEDGIDLSNLVEARTVTAAPYPRPAPPPASPRRIVRAVTPETATLIAALSAAHPTLTDPAANAYLAILDHAMLGTDPDVRADMLLEEAARLGLALGTATEISRKYLEAVVAGVVGSASSKASSLLATLP
jgi:hypothetical protein